MPPARAVGLNDNELALRVQALKSQSRAFLLVGGNLDIAGRA